LKSLINGIWEYTRVVLLTTNGFGVCSIRSRVFSQRFITTKVKVKVDIYSPDIPVGSGTYNIASSLHPYLISKTNRGKIERV